MSSEKSYLGEFTFTNEACSVTIDVRLLEVKKEDSLI